MKVAIIHDWLTTYAGAERVLEQILHGYPEADLFAVVDFIPEGKRDFLANKKSHTTFIQKLPFAKKKYRSYLPLMPLAIEQFDLSSYDIIVSSCHAVSKGVLTGPDQLHISYTHSPMRYAYDLQHQYLAESGLEKGSKGWIARYLLHRIRKWDIRTAHGVDFFVANSNFIARRIQKTYRRDSQVIYPPVDTEHFTPAGPKEDFYLAVSRLVPYKKMDLIVEAFAGLPDKRLKVIGDGPDMKKVRAKAGPNLEILGAVSHEELIQHLRRAKAMIFAAEEDFGISVVEAQACGTPVLAYGRGGATETVLGLNEAKPTGLFFERQEPQSIQAAVKEFEKHADQVTAENCRENAERFSEARFRTEFSQFVEDKWRDFTQQGRASSEPGSQNKSLKSVSK